MLPENIIPIIIVDICIRNPRKKWAQANVAFKKLKKYVHFNVIEKVEVAKMTKSR